jgi:4-alpha-glucanotransferase
MDRAALRATAERAGILAGYHAAGSGVWCEPTDRALAALLEALGAEAAPRETKSARAVAPCPSPREVAGPEPCFGLWLNLYALRGEPDFGIGNLTHLGHVVEWAAAAGAQFVGLSPLHALRNFADQVSPYGPKSRLFRNSLYLDPRAVPELESCAEAHRLLEAPEHERERAALAGSGTIAYERAAALQRSLLAALHADFADRHADGGSARGRAHAAFVARGGELLRDFATFSSLEDHFAKLGLARDWRSWPQEFRDRSPAALRGFRDEHASELSFHTYLQFELDRQLERVQARARSAGMRIGLYQDLAVGSLASSFDAWRFPELFVQSASIGAPPDAYAPEGQDWCMPPLHPRELVSGELEYARHLLQNNLGHAGALRIDHVMGLFRQYWIPRGLPGSEGAYVRFPARRLLELVATESRTAGAVVIGEDLGTVPRGLPLQLARAGLLSSRVLFFERERSGRFRPARSYSRRALATATTHDLPPLAGLWSERDLEIRRAIGAIPDEPALAAARAERASTRQALLERLLRDGDLAAAERAPSIAQLCRAVHTFLGRSPSPLVGISLDDLAGEVDPVNLPGIPQERHASWSRRMSTSVEALGRDPDVTRTLEAVARARRAAPHPIG